MRQVQEAPAVRVVRFELANSTLIKVIAAGMALWLLLRLWPVLLLCVAALTIVGTLSSTVGWLEARRISRGWSIALVFSVLVFISVLLLGFTLPQLLVQVSNLVQQEPALRGAAISRLSGFPLTIPLADALRTVDYDDVLKSLGASAFSLSTRLMEVVAYCVGAIFLALYIMIDRDRLRGALFSVVPRSHHIRLSRVMMNLETIVAGYIRGQIITCALMASFLFVLLVACGVPNPIALALFGGVADVLPYIGIFLTMGPAVVAAMSQGPVVTAIVFVLMLAYEELESRLLVPLIYGRAMRLPSSVVLLSLIAGAALGGVVGALLALPVAAASLMLVEELRIELPGEGEVAESAELRAKDELGEEEYERRTEGMRAEQAAAVAVEMSIDRKKEEEDAPREDVAKAG